MCSSASSAPCSFSISMTMRIGFPDCLADQLVGEVRRDAFGIEETARRHRRGSRRRAVLHADDVIFLTVPGRGVDGASSLLQRDVIAQDAERVPVDERMPENGAFQFVAVETGEDCRFAQPHFSAVAPRRSAATM